MQNKDKKTVKAPTALPKLLKVKTSVKGGLMAAVPPTCRACN